MVEVVRADQDGARQLTSMRWGLVPFFHKGTLKDFKAATFNARLETVKEKPTFRDAFKKRRCILPASGFYEWSGGTKDKQPHLFTAADGAPIIALAGLWESWRNPESRETLQSCTMIVSDPSGWMAPYHDRMPIPLQPQDFDAWLDGSLAADRLQPAAEDALREWPVSKRMNKTGEGDDDPSIIEQAA